MNKKEEIFKNNIPSFPEKSLILKAMQEYGKYCAEQAWAFAGVKPVITVVGESNQSEVFVTMTIRQFEEYAEYCADKAYGDGYTDALRDRPRRNFAVSGRSEQLNCDHPEEALIRDKPTDYCLACNRNI